jgi:hypothetical protein
MKDINNERNTMLRDGVLYDLVVSNEVECCGHCAFNGQMPCPGQCNSRSGDGYWWKPDNFS